ncbi:hypothetical protein GGR50DRAFT_694479 [Xylaria sp. CBS 124048]|nr:hypothetical protein GGR50DRAFT_694479 [Xylaria sp. CBS 124048]
MAANATAEEVAAVSAQAMIGIAQTNHVNNAQQRINGLAHTTDTRLGRLELGIQDTSDRLDRMQQSIQNTDDRLDRMQHSITDLALNHDQIMEQFRALTAQILDMKGGGGGGGGQRGRDSRRGAAGGGGPGGDPGDDDEDGDGEDQGRDRPPGGGGGDGPPGGNGGGGGPSDPDDPPDDPLGDDGDSESDTLAHRYTGPMSPAAYMRQPKNVHSHKRLHDNTLNLHRYHHAEVAFNDQERNVQLVFPQAILRPDSRRLGKCEARNKISFPSHMKLVKADAAVLDQLREFQRRLIASLVPYDMWAMRVSQEMYGDFYVVSEFIQNCRSPKWIDLLEAVIQVLGEHNALHSPLTTFVSILPAQGESYVNYLWRVREAYQRLQGNQRDTHQTRDVIVDKLRAYAPSIWLHLEYRAADYNNGQLMEAATRLAATITHTAIEPKVYGTPETTVQLQGTSAPFFDYHIGAATTDRPASAKIVPYDHTTTVPASLKPVISDPATDSREVSRVTETAHNADDVSEGTVDIDTNDLRYEDQGYVARPTDNRCFNCNKTGHFAKDCKQRPKWPRTNPSSGTNNGQSVTIKGRLFRNDVASRFKSNFKDKYKSFRRKAPIRKSGSNRVHFTDQPDSDGGMDMSPADRYEDDDAVIDDELRDLFDGLDE